MDSPAGAGCGRAVERRNAWRISELPARGDKYPYQSGFAGRSHSSLSGRKVMDFGGITAGIRIALALL